MVEVGITVIEVTSVFDTCVDVVIAVELVVRTVMGGFVVGGRVNDCGRTTPGQKKYEK